VNEVVPLGALRQGEEEFPSTHMQIQMVIAMMMVRMLIVAIKLVVSRY